MPTPFQSTYADRQDRGYEGMIANSEPYNAYSRTVETAAGIQFGRPVAKGSADRGCILMAAGQDFLGISRRDNTQMPSSGTNGDRVPQYKELAIVDDGVIFVKVGEPVVARAAANWDTATGLWTDAAVAGTVIAALGERGNTV